MDAAFPAGNTLWQRGAASGRSWFVLPSFHKLIRSTLRLRDERTAREHLCAFRSRVVISRNVIQETNKPAAEFLNSGEGVSLATRVLNGGLLSGPEIQAGQP